VAKTLERRAETRDVDRRALDWAGPSRQAYQLLRLAFVVAPTLAGLDKFFEVLTDWDRYLAPPFAQLLGGHTFMLIVGAVEIFAGLLVAVRPRIGGWLVAAWLAGIIFNLVVLNLTVGGGSWDIALRDLGLMIGAVALARLAAVHERAPSRRTARRQARIAGEAA
jgi:hypothetical protein